MDGQICFTGFENFETVSNGVTIVSAPADEYKIEPQMFELGVYDNPRQSVYIEEFSVDYTASNTEL